MVAFIIEPWDWDSASGTLMCHYTDGESSFTEQIQFGMCSETDEALAASFDLISITAGVSYYKAAALPEIRIETASPNGAWRSYVAKLYDDGLREFRFRNGLPLDSKPTVTVKADRKTLGAVPRQLEGVLIPMGGGRDSLLTAIALRSISPLLMNVGSSPIVRQQAKALNLEFIGVNRLIDPVLFRRNEAGAYNGHVPVTAINSSIAVALSVMKGCTDVVMSNEQSASEPTRIIGGIPVNHQYSKSSEFESLMRDSISSLGIKTGYFSLLRNLGELDISRILSHIWKELPPFLSCNRVFSHSKGFVSPSWCGSCAKCYFVFVSFAPFVPRVELCNLFGKDLLQSSDDITRIEIYLLGSSREFECIGTTSETQVALQAAARGGWADVPSLRDLVDRYPVEIACASEPPKSKSIPSHFLTLLDKVISQ